MILKLLTAFFNINITQYLYFYFQYLISTFENKLLAILKYK